MKERKSQLEFTQRLEIPKVWKEPDGNTAGDNIPTIQLHVGRPAAARLYGSVYMTRGIADSNIYKGGLQKN